MKSCRILQVGQTEVTDTQVIFRYLEARVRHFPVLPVIDLTDFEFPINRKRIKIPDHKNHFKWDQEQSIKEDSLSLYENR